MVIMNSMETDNSLETAKRNALRLENDKMKLEDELKEWLSVLSQNHVGMDEPLIDNEGFPRSDIDVYQVRHARHRIIYIRNDLKKLMKEIEDQLHIVHEESKNNSFPAANDEFLNSTPIIRVTSVSPNSPAAEAGLKIGDLILSFGSLNNTNFKNIMDIANIVQHSINQLIKVVILRQEVILKIYLKPHKWEGPGILGCVILPYENVER